MSEEPKSFLHSKLPRWIWSPTAWVVTFIYFTKVEYSRNRCFRSAAALTYVSIFAMLPLLALMSFVVPAFFGGSEALEQRVMGFMEDIIIPPTRTQHEEGAIFYVLRPEFISQIEPQDPQYSGPPLPEIASENSNETVDHVVDEALLTQQEAIGVELLAEIQKYFENFRQSYIAIGFVGAIGFLIMCSILYINIEHILNDMWNVRRRASFIRMFSRFIIILLCAPLMLGASFYMSVFITRYIGGTGRVVFMMLHLLIVTIFLTLAYYIIPRTQVNLKAALMGGILGGILWECSKIGFGYYLQSPQIRVLYKSVGAVPILLLWFYYGWLIFLLGSQVSYVIQYYRRMRRDRDCDAMPSMDYRWVLATAALVAQEFEKGRGGLPFSRLESSLPLMREDLERIVEFLISGEVIGRNMRGNILLERPPEKVELSVLLGPLVKLNVNVDESTKTQAGKVKFDNATWLEQGLPDLTEWAKDKSLADLL